MAWATRNSAKTDHSHALCKWKGKLCVSTTDGQHIRDWWHVLAFFLSVIFSEGKTGDGVEGWWGFELEASEDDKGVSRSSYVKNKQTNKKNSNSNNNFIFF